MNKRPAIIFDCDGVLLDTNTMKTDAFASVVAGYPEEIVKDFLIYQQQSFGKSRYVIFDQFFEKFLNREPKPDEKETLLNRFAEYVAAAYMTAEQTPAMEMTIQRLTEKFDLYIASGSDERELRDVFSKRNLSHYFNAIFGSPETKKNNLAKIAAESKNVTAMIGDAVSDFEAATTNGIPFIFMAGYSTVRDEMTKIAIEHGHPVIEDLLELDDALEKLDNKGKCSI